MSISITLPEIDTINDLRIAVNRPLNVRVGGSLITVVILGISKVYPEGNEHLESPGLTAWKIDLLTIKNPANNVDCYSRQTAFCSISPQRSSGCTGHHTDEAVTRKAFFESYQAATVMT